MARRGWVVRRGGGASARTTYVKTRRRDWLKDALWERRGNSPVAHCVEPWELGQFILRAQDGASLAWAGGAVMPTKIPAVPLG